MSHDDPNKWSLPGWRIEQRFSQGVLIGNWGEERYTFKKGNQRHNSTHRVDFKNWNSTGPDVIIRRKAELQNDGLGKEYLLNHHGNRYANNMVSWYDEHYNKRERDANNKLPNLRGWDSHRLAWLPEKSDHPIQGSATNFGLQQKLRAQWSQQLVDETRGDFNTTYGASYSAPVGYCKTRYAIPKETSSTLHRVNKVNRDMHFRGMPFLKAPETLQRPPLQAIV